MINTFRIDVVRISRLINFFTKLLAILNALINHRQQICCKNAFAYINGFISPVFEFIPFLFCLVVNVPFLARLFDFLIDIFAYVFDSFANIASDGFKCLAQEFASILDHLFSFVSCNDAFLINVRRAVCCYFILYLVVILTLLPS